MEFTKEFIEEHKLSTEQVTAVSGHYDNTLADVKKEYDGKANTDFQGIATGAAKSIYGAIGLEIDKGEKIADFITRAANKQNETVLSEAEAAKADYLEKSKNVKGNEAFAKEFEALKLKYDDSQKKHADYDTVKETAGKYETLLEKNQAMKLEVSFGQVKPNFPETVNAYEAAAKWNDFKSTLLNTHTIELVDGVAMVIDKENQFKTEKLADVVAKDSVLTELLKGREQGGTGAIVSKETITIEGVPFTVPVDANAGDRFTAIDTYLTTTKKLLSSSSEYSKLMGVYNDKILAQKNAA